MFTQLDVNLSSLPPKFCWNSYKVLILFSLDSCLSLSVCDCVSCFMWWPVVGGCFMCGWIQGTDTGKTLSNMPDTIGYYYWGKLVSGLIDVLKSACKLLIFMTCQNRPLMLSGVLFIPCVNLISIFLNKEICNQNLSKVKWRQYLKLITHK